MEGIAYVLTITGFLGVFLEDGLLSYSLYILLWTLSGLYFIYLGRINPLFCLLLALGFMALTIWMFSEIYLLLGVTTSTAESIYFSIVTWTTLGYGDIQPTGSARNYAASEAIIGYLYMGLIVSQFFRLSATEDSGK